MTGGLLQLAGVVVDFVNRIAHLPAAGEEVETLDFAITAGGGFNAMAAARRMGADVTYGGMLGQGMLAEIALRHLNAEGIAVAGTRRAAIDQGSCTVIIDKTGERSFISHHGAERRVDAAHLASLEAQSYDYALLTGYSLYKAESAAAFVPWLNALGRPPLLFFDPGPVVADIPKTALAPVMARADWVSANAREAQVLTGEAEPERAALQLAPGRRGALVRRGADGCWLACEGSVRHIRGFEVTCIDSNGAGDTHAGAFLAALIAGSSPEEAALLANAAAAISTTRIGPATSPGLEETRRFVKDGGRLPCPPDMRERAEPGRQESP
jgi:sugar/nucleoside kinase (ribokinase family)